MKGRLKVKIDGEFYNLHELLKKRNLPGGADYEFISRRYSMKKYLHEKKYNEELSLSWDELDKLITKQKNKLNFIVKWEMYDLYKPQMELLKNWRVVNG